ncbi:hypothetical protein V5799_014252, partial [Amblyomma americanum]
SCAHPNSLFCRPPVKLSDLVDGDYDVMRPPTIGDRPVTVNISVSVLNIRSVDEGRQFVEVDVFLHEQWHDWRLRNRVLEKIVVDPRWHPDIWTPEVYFKNSADGRLDRVIFPYAYITLKPSGDLFMAARVSLKLACNMDLTRFPHDNQLCDMQLSSLVHPREQMTLNWTSFRITKNLSLSQFKAIYVGHGDCTKSFDVGTFSCLYGRVELRRRAGFYLINKYAPSTIIVFMSFAAFWMPCEALPARVTLSVTSLLSLVTAQYQASMPGVSYVVAMNVWMIVSILFVFLGLVETALIVACTAGHKKGTGRWPKPVLVDWVARLLFPAAFLLHALIYWGIYGRD